MKFKLNNDLANIVFSFHNKIHFYVSMLIAIAVGMYYDSPSLGFYVAYGIWIAWEIWDGFKPLGKDFEYDEFQPFWLNLLRENTLYSDGFSYQDAFVWDFGGALIGVGIVSIIVG